MLEKSAHSTFCQVKTSVFVSILILCMCPLGLLQRSSLVLVAALSPPAGPRLSDHRPVPDLTQRPLGTPPPGPGVLLSELDPMARWYHGNNQLRVKYCNGVNSKTHNT